MAERLEVLGTTVVQYDDVTEFTAALQEAKPARVHTFCNSGLFGIGGSWNASFVDSEVAHGFATGDLSDGFKGRVRPIYDSMNEAGVPEVDGTLRVSERNGSIYQVFQTERPDIEERAQASYDAWVDAVRDLPVEGTLIQYLKDGSTVVLDATRGNTHLIIQLDEDSGRTLDDTLTRLQSAGEAEDEGKTEVLRQPYETRDNTPVVGWFKDMMCE